MSDRELANLLQRVLDGRGTVLQELYAQHHSCPWYLECVQEQVALRILVQRLRKNRHAIPHNQLDR